MNKAIKIGLIAIGIYALYQIIKKAKKASTSNGDVKPNQQVGETATDVAAVAFERPGSPGLRIATVGVVDTTVRRCIDENGKIVYVKGPCPTHKYVVNRQVVNNR